MLIPITITIAAAPLAIPFAFILRASVVARRTAASTPFTTAEQERPGAVVDTSGSRADE